MGDLSIEAMKINQTKQDMLTLCIVWKEMISGQRSVGSKEMMTSHNIGNKAQ